MLRVELLVLKTMPMVKLVLKQTPMLKLALKVLESGVEADSKAGGTFYFDASGGFCLIIKARRWERNFFLQNFISCLLYLTRIMQKLQYEQAYN